MTVEESPPISFGPLRWKLNRCAAIVLLVGFGSAVWIWCAQDRIDRRNAAAQAANPAASLEPLDSRKHVRDVEIYYGRFGLLLEEAEGLLHGKPLAKTIAVASALAAAGLFLGAARLPR